MCMCVHISFVENKRFAVENNPIFSPIFFSSKIAKNHYKNSFTTPHMKVYNDKFYDLLKILKTMPGQFQYGNGNNNPSNCTWCVTL